MSDSIQAALLSVNSNEHDDESIVVDNDAHFIIDAKTKVITNTGGKIQIVRGSHNSERITFECDRYIEGHDMLLCNVIRVHYFNVNKNGTYDVTDVTVKSDDDSKIIFTWLISSNATQNAGKIIFAIKFECTQDSGKVTYAWPTQINEELYCFDTLDNSETIVQENVDILEQWKKELIDSGGVVYEDDNGDIVIEVGGTSV